MDLARLVSLVAGIVGLAFATGVSLRTFMLPGSGPHFGTRVVFRIWQHVFLWVSRVPRSAAGREAVLSLYAPTALLTVVAFLVAMLGLAYALVFYGAGARDFGSALTFSASSISTLGFADPNGDPPLTLLTVLEAMSGASTIALLIGYLPNVFQAFQQREQAIEQLEAHVGDASSAVAILRHWSETPGLDRLDPVWNEWSGWFATLATTHSSLAGALFVRSPSSRSSWVAVAGAVLDAAALATTSLELADAASARRCLQTGASALRQIVAGLGIAPDAPAGRGEAAISVTRADYDAACDALAAAGLPVIGDREAGWAAFRQARADYDGPLVALCRLKRVTEGTWSGDRPAARRVLHLPVIRR